MATVPRHMQVAHEGSSENGAFAESSADIIHAGFKLLPLDAGVLIAEHIQLHRTFLRHKVDRRHANGSNGPLPAIPFLQQNTSCLRDLHGALRRVRQLHLVHHAVQLVFPDIEPDAFAAQVVLPQPAPDVL